MLNLGATIRRVAGRANGRVYVRVVGGVLGVGVAITALLIAAVFTVTGQAGVTPSAASQLRTEVVVVAVVGLFLLGGVTALIAMVETRPIRAVVDAARLIAAGDVSARADTRGAGELKELAQAFNAMVDRLGGMVERVRDVSTELAELSGPALRGLEPAGQHHLPAGLGGGGDLGEHGGAGPDLGPHRRHRGQGGLPGG